MSLVYDIGHRLKFAREAWEASQKELADSSGLSHSIITKIESGRIKHPRTETTYKFISALDLPQDYFDMELERGVLGRYLKEMMVSSGLDPEAADMIVQRYVTISESF